MIKTAIYVEGNTELVFVREYLKKTFDNQNLEIECKKRRSNRFDDVPKPFKSPNAQFHFRIIDVGGDDKVLDDILKDEKLMINIGYQKIIGLRDMYSESYKKIVKQPLRIDSIINQKFIDRAQDRINNNAEFPEKIHFHFAIMEIEAWLLAIPSIWQAKKIPADKIKSIFKGDNLTIDLETTFLHPAETIKAILKTVNESYDKHASEVESLVSFITKQDFLELQQSNRCNSFTTFTNSVI